MPKQDMSFLPEDYIERRIESRTNVVCLGLFGLVLIGVVGAYVVTYRQQVSLRRQRQEVNTEYTDAARRIEQLDQLHQRKQRMLQKARVTATLLEPVPRSFLLAELINRMPHTLSLLELKMTSKKITQPVIRAKRHQSALSNATGKPDRSAAAGSDQDLDGPVQGPRYKITIALKGVAPTDVQVSEYMAALHTCDLLANVNLVISEEKPIMDTTMRQFHIEMSLRPSADVRRMDPVPTSPHMVADPMRDPGGPATGAATGSTPDQPEPIAVVEPNGKD